MPDENGEPLNMREAIEMRVATGDPAWGVPNEHEAPEPVVDVPAVPGDEFTDIVPEPGTEPTATGAPSTEPVPEPVVDDPFAAYGGKQVVEDAVTIAAGLRTETGVRAIAAQSLQALGYTADEIKAFFDRQQGAPVPAGAPADPLDQIGDDDVITGADARRLIEAAVNRVAEQVSTQALTGQQALEAQIQADRSRVAQEAVDGTLTQLLDIKDGKPNEAQLEQIALIQAAAGTYIDPNDWNPQNIRNAIIRGKADVDTMIQRQTEAYIARKRAERDAVPANIGGSTPGGEEVKEPRNLKEARQMAKDQGFFQ